jgi:hypothetical protein
VGIEQRGKRSASYEKIFEYMFRQGDSGLSSLVQIQKATGCTYTDVKCALEILNERNAAVYETVRGKGTLFVTDGVLVYRCVVDQRAITSGLREDWRLINKSIKSLNAA